MADDAAHAAATRQAAEMILQDERLTADLEDAEANVLLDWALAAAEAAVTARLDRGDSLDREAVAETVSPIRQVARSINDLVAESAPADRGRFLAHLLSLIDAAGRLPRAIIGHDAG